MAENNSFFKNKETDKIWWKSSTIIGERLFSFDKETVFNLFEDFPWSLTKEQVELFKQENPEWANFFSDRMEVK